MYRKHAVVTKVKNSRKPNDLTGKIVRNNFIEFEQEQTVSLSTRRPTLGATAQEEYEDARSKACARALFNQTGSVDTSNNNSVEWKSTDDEIEQFRKSERHTGLSIEELTGKIIRNNCTKFEQEQTVSLSTRRPTLGATAQEEYEDARSKACARTLINQNDIIDSSNNSAQWKSKDDEIEQFGGSERHISQSIEEIPDKIVRKNCTKFEHDQTVSLSTRRPTLGATAQEEYEDARSKACARALINQSGSVDSAKNNSTQWKSSDSCIEQFHGSKQHMGLSIEELKQHMQATCSNVSTKADNTLREIEIFFEKCHRKLKERQQILCQQVMQSTSSLEHNIKLEYGIIEKNLLNDNSKMLADNSHNNFDLNYLSADVTFLWNSKRLEDIISELETVAVVDMLSMVPSKTQISYGIGNVGHTCRLEMITFTPYGTRCISGGMTLTAFVYDEVPERALECDIMDNNDGTYHVCFLPTHPGTYNVSMCIGNTSPHSINVGVQVFNIVATLSPAFVNVESKVSICFHDTSSCPDLSSLSAIILTHSGDPVDTTCTVDNGSMYLIYTPVSAESHVLLIRSSTGHVISSYNICVGKLTLGPVFANVESSVTLEHMDIADMDVQIETFDGQDVPIAFMGGERGTQTYKFIPETKGTLRLQVKRDDNTVLWTNISVGALVVDVKSAVVNGICTVNIDACDCSGFLLKEIAGDIQLTAQLSSPNGSMEKCDVTFTDGSWQISYLPRLVGYYHMVLFLDDVVFRESPIKIEVNGHVEIYGGPSSEFFGSASDICTSVDGRIFIADTAQNNRIVILDSDGRFHSSIPVRTKDVSLITSNISGTKLYLLCIVKKIMEVYDICTRKRLMSVVMNGVGAPSALVFDNNDNTLLISDTEHKCILVIDPESCKEEYQIRPVGSTLHWPSDVCVDDMGTVYVCDTDASKVVVMDKRGFIGKPFGAEGGIKDPIAVAVDDDYRLLVLLRAQQMCLYGMDRKIMGILKAGGGMSRRSKLQIMPDGYCIKTNEKENCLRRYHYASIEKSTNADMYSRRIGRRRGRLFSSNGSLLISSRSANTSPDSLCRMLRFQFQGGDRKSQSCLDLSSINERITDQPSSQ